MSDNSGKISNLQTLGLSPLEAELYAHLVESGSATALSLSRALAIPRTSVYDTLTKLTARGLAQTLLRPKSTHYQASPVSSLSKLIHSHEEQLTDMTKAFSALEAQLQSRVGELKNTEVRYYQGAEGMRQMVWNCLRAHKEIVGYSVFGRVDVIGLNFQQRFVKEFADRGLTDRVIANPTRRTLDFIFKDVKPGFHQMSFQNIRTLPVKELYIAGDTMIYNDVYAVSYWPVPSEANGEVGQGHEVVGVEIENADFVKHELSIFELLWKLARPISPQKK
jgi:sugar-specific transcriptional regulator TrmB